MTSTTQTRHDLNDEALGKYLQQHLLNLSLPVISTKIGYGQSNPTYYVDDANRQRYILRKKPSGTIISPVAHQVDREYRVLKALGTVKGFPVPKVYCLCMDQTVIGTAFYVSFCSDILPVLNQKYYLYPRKLAIDKEFLQVMQHVEGRIIKDPDLTELSPADRRLAWFSVIRTLAKLHSIDPDTIRLSSFGKKSNFYARHCKTFSRIEAQQAQVKDIKTGAPLGRAHPSFDEVVAYIRGNLPAERSCIIHGDYKFDNIVLHPTEPRVVAVLDWELSTIGHPLMDCVYVTGPYWNRYSKVGLGKPRDDQGGEVYEDDRRAESGMPDMEELLDEYAAGAGWDPRRDAKEWEVAKVFHLMRVSLSCIWTSMIGLDQGILIGGRAAPSAMVFRHELSVGKQAANFRMSISRIRRKVSMLR